MKSAIFYNGWHAISDRIESIIKAFEVFLKTLKIKNEDVHNAQKNVLQPQLQEIFESIIEYRQKFRDILPGSVLSCINQFLERYNNHFKKNEIIGLPLTQIRIIALIGFRSQLEYLFSDLEIELRSTVERAFLHLQRSIISDDIFQDKWKKAFESGEIACEKLGATHLLWHGIWAFKVDAAGARTDLVLGNRIDNLSEINRSSLGLVLTEWKLSKNEKEITKQYESGKKQAQKYTGGILSGVELQSTRYIINVTLKDAPPREDEIIGNLIYRFINIAVDPDVPSKSNKIRSV